MALGNKIFDIAQEQRVELGDNDEITDVQFVMREVGKIRALRLKEYGPIPQTEIDCFAQTFLLDLKTML